MIQPDTISLSKNSTVNQKQKILQPEQKKKLLAMEKKYQKHFVQKCMQKLQIELIQRGKSGILTSFLN